MAKEKSKKNQKGITLIALIITIIVMMILVGVTVAVALNGGIFDQARQAAKDTEKHTIYDQIIAAMQLKNNGKVDVDDTYKQAKAALTLGGKTVEIEEPASEAEITEGTTKIVFTVQGKSGTYKYEITDVEVESEGHSEGEEVEPTDIPEELSKYILGADGKGKNIEEFLSDYGFVQDPEDTNSTIHEKIKLAYIDYNEETDEEIWYIRYNREIYKFKKEYIEDPNDKYGQERVVEGSLEKVSTSEGNLGKYVEYAGNTWIVLRENSTGVELITANTTENEVTIGGSDFDTAKDSYNAAVETLVDECKDVCKEEYGIEIGGIVTGIRCVGGPAKDETTGTIDFSKIVPNADFPFEEYTGKNIKVGDDKYLEDCNQMKKIGILCTDNMCQYWLASRHVQIVDKDNEIAFRIRCIGEAMNVDSHYVFYTYFAGGSYPCKASCALRPVVTLESGILNGATESGLIDDPIILD